MRVAIKDIVVTFKKIEIFSNIKDLGSIKTNSLQVVKKRKIGLPGNYYLQRSEKEIYQAKNCSSSIEFPTEEGNNHISTEVSLWTKEIEGIFEIKLFTYDNTQILKEEGINYQKTRL